MTLEVSYKTPVRENGSVVAVIVAINGVNLVCVVLERIFLALGLRCSSTRIMSRVMLVEEC